MTASPYRWRLHRAGLLNVWQYDDQVFEFADGRLLLRGTNGAGKSKTLEMLLPFLLDADRGRMDASGRRGTALTWLMLDGYDGASRTGYLWLHLRRDTEDGGQADLTLGVGLRAAGSTKSVNLWCFLLPGAPIGLEDAAGVPLSAPGCREAVTAAGGEFFDSPRAYKAAVGRRLFGLDEARYDELLRLLYWLRSPQVGESVEVAQLSRTLAESLPELDRVVVEAAATSLDELQEFGEQLERRERASEEVQRGLAVYRRYAAGEVRRRTSAVLDASSALAGRQRGLGRAERMATAAVQGRAAAAGQVAAAGSATESARERERQLASSQEARDLEALEEMARAARDSADAAVPAAEALRRAAATEVHAVQARERQEQRVDEGRRLVSGSIDAAALRFLGLTGPPPLRLDALAEHEQSLVRVDAEVGAALAAVGLCREALEAWEREHAAQRAAEDRAERTAAQAEASRRDAQQAQETEERAQHALALAVATWLAAAPVPGAPEDEEQAVAWAAEVTAEPVAWLEQAVGRLGGTLTWVAAERAEVVEERVRVAAERDPAPPLPALERDPRDPAVGTPLWRLVDVRPGVPAGELAAVEAALQAAGLLDALVLPDGRLRTRDQALVGGDAVPGPTLADVLVAVPDSVVDADIVDRALRRVALGGDGEAVVRRDGSWQLGPLEGRASKPAAQYLGVVARESERARRLADLDARLVALDAQAAELTAERDAARGEILVLTGWRDGAPGAEAVVRARLVAGERADVAGRDDAARDEAERAAQQHRARTAETRRLLEERAAAHALPTQRAALAERAALLRDVRRQVVGAGERLAALWAALQQLEDLGQAAERAAEDRARAADAGERARARAEQAAQRYDARKEALSATQQELERALAEAAEELSDAQSELAAAHAAELAAVEAATKAEESLVREREHLDQAERDHDLAERRARALRAAPGLVGAVTPEVDAEWAALHAAVAELPTADGNAVQTAYRDLLSGTAGALQPRLVEAADGLYVLTGRDDAQDGAEVPLSILAERLAARVEADRALLTAQQRQVCERHLLGELGEVLRVRRLEAEALVGHMNRLLDGVRTSQGIRVRLEWKLRDDLATEARETVRLLDRPIGSLLPEQRERLLGLLSELIETARREDPDAGYAEHLRLALDYRTWSTFSVRIRRAGAENEERLTRRTALSQGEQKVVCYLPLFAAAAAHFSSVAVEEPLAPRFVLLDDAFPKIDVKTHPVLFGLLVDLELDWLITSERLWADCATVPAVAVYEVMRSPTERGVLPFKHLWDGRRLTAVGM
jgi:uncharacterized protein (TIGR02680 family)